MTAEGRSSETTGEDSDGMFPEGLMDDDRWKMVGEGSVISISGRGMSMGAFISSGFSEEKHANMGVVDSNWRIASKEECYSSRQG